MDKAANGAHVNDRCHLMNHGPKRLDSHGDGKQRHRKQDDIPGNGMNEGRQTKSDCGNKQGNDGCDLAGIETVSTALVAAVGDKAT